MSFWGKHRLFSPQAVGSVEKRTCPHRNWHASFRQILPMTALKFLDLRQQAGEILPCPRQNLLENPRTIPMWTGSKSYPEMHGAIIHSDRGSQYTSKKYRCAIMGYGIIQSMNSVCRRCHYNARCESMWARMKDEMFYLRNRNPENYTMDELKTIIWRYFLSYWNNRRICSAIGGVPPPVKRRNYYAALNAVAQFIFRPPKSRFLRL